MELLSNRMDNVSRRYPKSVLRNKIIEWINLGWDRTTKFPITNSSAATASDKTADLFKIWPFLVAFKLILVFKLSRVTWVMAQEINLSNVF